MKRSDIPADVTRTVLEELVARIRQAAVYNRHDLAAPSVILWTDGEGLWARVIPLLRGAMPELLALDREVADEHTGPSTWVRYRLARGSWREVPVIYLRGVPRHAFRGAAGFPEGARHVYTLQYQGQFWSQANGKDWTPSAFLASREGGLDLDLARDRATLEALSTQLARVLRAPLASLSGRRLEAADFHDLAADDPAGMLLEWMSGQEAVKEGPAPDRWFAFAALCKRKFSLDPDKDGVITAAERLVAGGGAWDQVWKRYCQAPKTYAGVRKALELVKPKDLVDAASDRVPANNRKEEDALRKALKGLAGLGPKQAQAELASLCAKHVPRAATVWAELGEAPLAGAAVHLQALCNGMAADGLGNDWDAIADGYLSRAWTVDAAAWRAYAAVRDAPDLEAVTTALRASYLPWLRELAEWVQGWTPTYPASDPTQSPAFAPKPGTVLVFVDGLRCDLAVDLAQRLEASGFRVRLDTRWAALPTVTATAKPAWQPLAEQLKGKALTEGFEPQAADSGKPLKSAGFRKRVEALGWAWLEPTATGDTTGAAWTEIGTLDHDGHGAGARLAWRIEDELNAVGLRVQELLAAGWREAVVITDHGWLLVPGGLPKVDLPGHLTLSRWSRCAVGQPGIHHGFREVHWFWGGGHSVVLAPGISAFTSGVEYAHGGLSVQEALTPVLTVSARAEARALEVTIESVKWVGLRLKVQLRGGYADTVLDIRAKPADAESTLLGAEQGMKPPADHGSASLLIESDEHLGAAAVLVVIRDGQVVAKQPVTIGED